LSFCEFNSRRPFYSEYAWAFDLLIDRPVRKECGVIATWLRERDVCTGASLLDAGCGTGRYAAELARRGYVVHGVDLSAELIDQARRRVESDSGTIAFAVGDIAILPAARYDAILCRGVLNDIVGDGGRQAVLRSFARTLRLGGVLILDVREWEASAERKVREPVFRKSVETDRGKLTFTSVTTVDHAHRQLLLSERHTLVDGGHELSSDYQFVMRCWTRDELASALADGHFHDVAYFGAYESSVPAGSTDRLVAVARR
jgi:SAM-dependent methyltransferase